MTRAPRPLELVATVLAACGIGLLTVASVSGLRETRRGPDKAVAFPVSAPVRSADGVRPRVRLARPEVATLGSRPEAPSHPAQAAAAVSVAAPRSAAVAVAPQPNVPRAPTIVHRTPTRYAPKAPLSAPRAPTPRTPNPRAPSPRSPTPPASSPPASSPPASSPPASSPPAPTPSPPSKHPAKPAPNAPAKSPKKTQPPPPVGFDERGNGPQSGTETVPFDDSGGGSSGR